MTSSCQTVFFGIPVTGAVCQRIQQTEPKLTPISARSEGAVKAAPPSEAVSMLPSGMNLEEFRTFQPGSVMELLS